MEKTRIYAALALFLSFGWFNSQKIYAEDKAYKDIQKTQINKPKVGTLDDLPISDENVNLSTGVLMPIISVMDINSKFLNSDVKLVYKNGNGVRVNDISSDIGLGWDIEAGGYISRKVNGFVDEGKLYNDAQVGVPGNDPIFQINGNNFLNGWLDFANWSPDLTPQIPAIMPRTPGNNQSLGSAIQSFVNNVKSNNFDTYKWFRYFNSGIYIGPDGGGGWPSNTPPIGGSTIADICATSGFGWQFYDIDGEPDEYYFNFGKYSGKFVFDGDRVPTIIPHIPGLKIESPYGSSNNSWIFTTPDGTKYYFNNTASYYEVLNSATNTAPFRDDWSGTTPNVNEGLGISEYISKWYLSKIVAINGEEIEYVYSNLPDLIYNEKSEIKQVFRPSLGSTQSPPSHFPVSFDAGFHERILDRTTSFRLKSPKRLLTIKTSDNNRIDFIYNGSEREDIDQSQNSVKRKSLSSVEKYDYNNKMVEKINFIQSYFNSGCSSYECKRLRLDNIKKINTETLQNYLTTSFEYYSNENLPKRNSHQQDYWGYHNNNNVNSLIPQINTFGGYNYAGADRTPSDAKTKANILSKITYPTQGTIEYEYELNDFKASQFNTFPITNNKTGGLRIKKIIKKDHASSIPITKLFSYKLSDGTTSGELPNLLLNSTMQENNNGAGRMFERQKVEVDQNSGETSVYIMIYSNPKYLFTNDLIRYSKVKVEIEGKGSEEYTLSSFTTNPDSDRIGRHWTSSYSGFQPTSSTITNSIYSYTVYNTPTLFTPDNSYMRGLLLNKVEKDYSGNILRETINEYKINPAGYLPKTIYGIGSSSVDSFIAEDSRINSIDFMINFHKNDYVYLENTKVKDYVDNPPIESIETNTYNSLAFLSSKNISLANNDVYSKAYKYANDKQIQKLIDANITNIPLETQIKKNDEVISRSEVKYDNTGNLYPSSILEYDLASNTAVSNITYDLYDDKGNLLQYTTKFGIPVTIIWGYKSTQPIARIEGITYTQLANIFGFPVSNVGYRNLDIVTKSDADNNYDYEKQTLLPSLNLFRQNSLLKDFKVTTYTYDPLQGVTTITLPSGHVENYQYDGTNKLEKITDQNGNIVKEYKYNYARKVHYSAQRSQPFTKNNCANGQISSAIIYTVPYGQYTSLIDQADADQKAIDDINANGQNYANANGTCYNPYCQLNTQSSTNYVMLQYAPFEKANNTVNAQIYFQVTSNQGLDWTNQVILGNVESLCWPSTTISRTSGNWQINIYPASGQTTLRWIGSGGPAVGGYYSVNFSYNLN